MPKRIVVLGGGIGGMTAAHELASRGFEVDVYEETSDVGGKAKSQFLEGTGTGGRENLPGEHGFRFFPSFYRHVIDTMQRIPVEKGTVADRLRESQEMGMAEKSGIFVFDRHPPEDVGDFVKLTKTVDKFFTRTEVSERDMARFSYFMLRFLASCDERREADFEQVSFWDFVEGDTYEPKFQKYIKTPRFMVAMDPRHGSARTIGTKACQILLDFVRNGTRTDAVLDGPTTERWLRPWRTHLESLGVRFHYGDSVTELLLDGKRLKGARIGTQVVTGDHYVLALPLDRVQAVISDELAAIDPDFAGIRRLANATSWMCGAQFFLKKDPKICHGHVAFPDSYWALSSVSQGQFWSSEVAARYGDGSVGDILSVDISDWETVSPRIGKAARDCTSDEILEEVWMQLTDGLGGKLSRDNLVRAHLDYNVSFDTGRPVNRTPLLVHPPGSWWNRPGAVPDIENVVIASDYVKTNTDLASMEGANEAARRAVNGILAREESAAEACDVYPMDEDAGPFMDAMRKLDRLRFLAQTPHVFLDPAGAGGGGPRPGSSPPPPSSGGFLPETFDDLRSIERRVRGLLGF